MDWVLINILLIWTVMAVNIGLTLRVIALHRERAHLMKQAEHWETVEEITIGSTAPEFTARTLNGDFVSRKDLKGNDTLIIFFSTSCPMCRHEMPLIHELGRRLFPKGTKVILACDNSAKDVLAWKDALLREDKLKVELPIFVAPRSFSDLVTQYDPRALTPYFCLIGSDLIVKERGPIGAEDWQRLKSSWLGIVPVKVQLAMAR